MKTKKPRSYSRRIVSAFVVSLVVHLFILIPLLVSIMSNDPVPGDDEQARLYEVEIHDRELEENLKKERELVRNTEETEDSSQKSPQKVEEEKEERPPPREKPKKKRPEKRKLPKKRPVKLKDKKLEFRKKMVHQETPEEEEAPDDFRFYAEKNRNVEEETRAEKTQLTMVESKKHQLLKEKEKIAETTPEFEKRDKQKKVNPKTPHSRKTREKEKQEESPKRALEKRTEERKKQETHEGKKKPKQDNVLSMRRSVDPLTKMDRRKTARDKTGEKPAERKAAERERTPKSLSRSGERRLVDIKVRPTTRALQHLFGKEWAEEYERTKDSERHASKGRASAHPSEKRWKEIKAGIENYIAEVRPGRVTSLRTRANPFAKYISAVHRNIHPLWGDGFLVDWSSKDPDDPMNKRDRWAMVEMVVNGDGTLHKAGLVKSSGYLPYDAAAMDVVFSAAPFVRAPANIRSADGKVYMHWRFHRNHRQCGTFGVDAYILTAPEKESGKNKAHTDSPSDIGATDSVKWDPARSFKRIPAEKQTPDP